MAEKIRLTRPELKKRRDDLARYERYLPTLKLKQQQLQASVLEAERYLRQTRASVAEIEERMAPYRALRTERSGIDLEGLSNPREVRTGRQNVAGVVLPVYEEALFPEADYSLFATPPWVDRALADGREYARRRAEADIAAERVRLLRRELTRIIQRVNLFEKIKIPKTREAIRVIRIFLGDEQTAGVARAKIAKAKISLMEEAQRERMRARAAEAAGGGAGGLTGRGGASENTRPEEAS